MNKEMIMSLAGSAMRKGLVFVIAKYGASTVIDDSDVAGIVNAVLALGVIVWGCIEKRKALLADPKKAA